MTAAQPDWHERFFALHDHINADGRGTATLMLAPSSDYAQIMRADTLTVAPDRELTADEATRLCLLVTDIAAVDDGVSVMIWPNGEDGMLQPLAPAAGYVADCELARHVVANLVGAPAPVEPPTKVMPAWLASAPGYAAPVAANDNFPIDPWAEQKSPSLPDGLLPPVVEAFARTQAEIMGVDPGGVAMAALAVAAAALPDRIKVQVKQHNSGWTESARLWVALVGNPSTKKSPIVSAVSEPLRGIDRELYERYRDAKQAYDSLDKKAKAMAVPPRRERLMVEDATIEATGEILKDSPNGVLLYQDELSGWFGSMDKYSGGRGSSKDRAFWLQAFNGGPYSVSRIGRGDLWIDNLSVSLLGGIQPSAIRAVAADAVDDGLLQRLLPVVLSRASVGKDVPATAEAQAWEETIRRLHVMEKPRAGLLECNLRFSPEAQAIRNDREALHHSLSTAWEDVNGKLASHFGKHDGVFARLCVLWHCVETGANWPQPEISADVASRVARFMDQYIKPHAVAFYTNVLGMSDDHDALLATAGWVLTHRPSRVSVREVRRGDRLMRNLSTDDAATVLGRLDALGWLDQMPAARRDQQQWTVKPEVYAVFDERAKTEKARREQVRALIAASLK